ncbi:hypothetical protein NMG60_11019308 [Bertholletia excelsa]
MQEIKIDSATTFFEEQRQPLCGGEQSASIKKPRRRKAIRKTFKISALLSNLLPTGSVLAFEFFSPVITHQGQCTSFLSKYLTAGFLALCSLSCFLLCFTDSFRDDRGKVRYGFATRGGLWTIDGSTIAPPPEEAENYRLRLIDFFHALLSILVFAAVALFDQNLVKCFCPKPSDKAKDLLSTLPVGTGVVCCLLFVCFPSRRHGIGFPLSRR